MYVTKFVLETSVSPLHSFNLKEKGYILHYNRIHFLNYCEFDVKITGEEKTEFMES